MCALKRTMFRDPAFISGRIDWITLNCHYVHSIPTPNQRNLIIFSLVAEPETLLLKYREWRENLQNSSFQITNTNSNSLIAKWKKIFEYNISWGLKYKCLTYLARGCIQFIATNWPQLCMIYSPGDKTQNLESTWNQWMH